MENIIFYVMLVALILVIIDIEFYARRIIKEQSNILNKIDDIKLGNIQLSTYDCIAISNTIATLKRIEEEKVVSYKDEISLLTKILYNGQQ